MNYIIVVFTWSIVCVYTTAGQLAIEGNHHCFRELQNFIYYAITRVYTKCSDAVADLGGVPGVPWNPPLDWT